MAKSTSGSDQRSAKPSKDLPLTQVLGDVSQLAIEQSDVEPPENVKRAPVFSDGPVEGAQDTQYEELEQKDTEPERIAGYDPADIVKAPIEPPKPVVKDTKYDTSNKSVKFLVFAGAASAAIGLILVFSIFSLGIVLIIIGATLAAVAVFAPIRPHQKATAKNPR